MVALKVRLYPFQMFKRFLMYSDEDANRVVLNNSLYFVYEIRRAKSPNFWRFLFFI